MADNIWQRLIAAWRTENRTLPSDSALRKEIPLYTGLMAYAPAALVCIAARSAEGGKGQHGQSEGIFHDRDRSIDHLDCELRHCLDQMSGEDHERLVHSASKAWRALMDLQILCEELGAPRAPAARSKKDSK